MELELKLDLESHNGLSAQSEAGQTAAPFLPLPLGLPLLTQYNFNDNASQKQN